MGLLLKFLFLDIVTVGDGQRLVLLSVWAVMVFLGLWSIVRGPWRTWAKMAWSLLIIGVPILGLFVYVVACLVTAEWELLKQMGFFSRSKKQVVKSIQSQET